MVIKGDEPHRDPLRNPGNEMVSPACPPVVGDDELQHVLVFGKEPSSIMMPMTSQSCPAFRSSKAMSPSSSRLKNPLPTRDLPRVPRVRIGMGDAQPIQPLGLACGLRDAALPCDQIEHPFPSMSWDRPA